MEGVETGGHWSYCPVQSANESIRSGATLSHHSVGSEATLSQYSVGISPQSPNSGWVEITQHPC